MRHLGVLDALEETAFLPPVTEFRLFDNGEVLQALALAATHEDRHGAPYLQLHRADYHAVLAARIEALDPGCIRLNATAAGFRENGNGVTLMLADGTNRRRCLSAPTHQIGSAAPDRRRNRRKYTGDSACAYRADRAAAAGSRRQISIGSGPAAWRWFISCRGSLPTRRPVELEEEIEESGPSGGLDQLKADFDGCIRIS